VSSSLIYGINHTNIYVELAIGNCTQYTTFYLKLRQLAIGIATKYFNTITLAKNPGDHPRTKHIQLHYHFIQFVIANGQVNLEYVPTKHMAADGLTKALMGKKHSYFVRLLGMETRPSGSVKVV